MKLLVNRQKLNYVPENGTLRLDAAVWTLLFRRETFGPKPLGRETFGRCRLAARRLDAGLLDARHLDAKRLNARRLDAGRLAARHLDVGRVVARRLDARHLDAGRLDARHLLPRILDAVVWTSVWMSKERGPNIMYHSLDAANSSILHLDSSVPTGDVST